MVCQFAKSRCGFAEICFAQKIAPEDTECDLMLFCVVECSYELFPCCIIVNRDPSEPAQRITVTAGDVIHSVIGSDGTEVSAVREYLFAFIG